MRKDVIDLAQTAIWDSPLGDPVSVFAPRADVATDAPIWTGTAIRMCPRPRTHPAKGSRINSRFEGLVFAWPARPC